MPLRLWLALALVAIVGVPTLTTWVASNALAARPQRTEAATLRAVEGIVGQDPTAWRDPLWQRWATGKLAGLGVEAVVDDAAGAHAFATRNGLMVLRRWAALAGGPLTVKRLAYLNPLPSRLFTTIVAQAPLSGGPPTAHRPSLGVAYLWLTPSRDTGVAAWAVPLAGLAALLLTLAVVAVFLARAVLRPLAALGRIAGQIAGGDLDVRAPTSRAREVAEVSAALAAMSTALRESLERQATLEQERRLFIGAVAHDLRTPLFMLRGYLEGLEGGIATTPAKVAEYIRECRAKADALEHLIADLFTYTRVEYLEQAPQRDLLELGSLLRRSVEGMRPQAAAKGVTLTACGTEKPCPFVGDSHLLARAVGNLLDNGLRHTPAGGEVRVIWGVEGAHLAFRVEDTGPGIAAQDLPHLFAPLYRGESSRNRQTGGAGLGLSIARRILQAHGGDLTAANAVMGGAAFTATLPVEQSAYASIDGASVTCP